MTGVGTAGHGLAGRGPDKPDFVSAIANVGYVTVYPAAMITKILLAQVLLSWLM